MRRLLAALSVLALCVWGSLAPAQSPVGTPTQIICNKQAQLTISTATTTAAITGVAGQNVFICGWHFTTSNSANASTFQLEYGTQGGPCTTPTTLTPAFSVTSTAPSADHIEFASIQVPAAVAPGNQVCVVSTGATVQLSGILWYAQF